MTAHRCVLQMLDEFGVRRTVAIVDTQTAGDVLHRNFEGGCTCRLAGGEPTDTIGYHCQDRQPLAALRQPRRIGKTGLQHLDSSVHRREQKMILIVGAHTSHVRESVHFDLVVAWATIGLREGGIVHWLVRVGRRDGDAWRLPEHTIPLRCVHGNVRPVACYSPPSSILDDVACDAQ